MVQITGGRLGRYATGTAEVCGWCRSQVEVLVTVQLVSCCRVGVKSKTLGIKCVLT